MSDCKPKVATKVVQHDGPPPESRPLECINCGCTVLPGSCHCGATNHWHFDCLDGWWVGGNYPPKEIHLYTMGKADRETGWERRCADRDTRLAEAERLLREVLSKVRYADLLRVGLANPIATFLADRETE